MKLSILPFDLEFRYPFGVSSHMRTHTPVVYIKIAFEDYEGYGEAALPPYLGETRESVISFLKKAEKILSVDRDEFDLNELISAIDRIEDGNNAAKAAVDIALHDLIGKIYEQPVYEMLGCRFVSKPTSHTIAIGENNLLEQKINEAKDFQFLKVKLGTNDDRKIINEIRKFTDKPLYVDVNQGWKEKSFVIDMLHWLKDQNVVLVEQPMPVSMLDEMEEIKEKSPLPLIADENIKRFNDLEHIPFAFHGVNIKLMKSTGIREAKAMAQACKKLDLKVYLGCMGESSCATTAMAHLIEYADYVDLDAPLLIKNDPFCGIEFKNGMVTLPDAPGTSANTRLEF